VAVRAENIDQSNFVAFFVRTDRVVERHVFTRFFQGTQMHQNLNSIVKRVLFTKIHPAILRGMHCFVYASTSTSAGFSIMPTFTLLILRPTTSSTLKTAPTCSITGFSPSEGILPSCPIKNPPSVSYSSYGKS